MIPRRLAPFAVLALAALPLAVPAVTAHAANLPVEISTAATHAGLASKAGTVKMVHTHLHHTLNCLVGPKGKAFDKAELDPCGGLGAGAIPDARKAAEKKQLRAAVAEAERGLKADDLGKAQKIAATTASMLKKIR